MSLKQLLTSRRKPRKPTPTGRATAAAARKPKAKSAKLARKPRAKAKPRAPAKTEAETGRFGELLRAGVPLNAARAACRPSQGKGNTLTDPPKSAAEREARIKGFMVRGLNRRLARVAAEHGAPE